MVNINSFLTAGFSGPPEVAGCSKGLCVGNLGQFDASLLEPVSNSADMLDTSMSMRDAANSAEGA